LDDDRKLVFRSIKDGSTRSEAPEACGQIGLVGSTRLVQIADILAHYHLFPLLSIITASGRAILLAF
jgi:hypothetical protein